MFSHIMVGTNDIERAKRFYDAVLGTLGAGEPIRNASNTGHHRLFIVMMAVHFALLNQSMVKRR